MHNELDDMINVNNSHTHVLPPVQETNRLLALLKSQSSLELTGRVEKAVGTLIESSGPMAAVGDLCLIASGDGKQLPAEVVGFRGRSLLLMPLDKLEGITPGSPVSLARNALEFGFTRELVGRVLDGLGNPLDDKPMPRPEVMVPFDREAPSALSRPAIHEVFHTGVRALDGLLTFGVGQRIGVFAGSGVGKSTLMGMLARGSQADINVIGLIGERGREVGEFVRDQLGEEGLKRSVVVAATSDRSPMERIKGALLATAIAEGFRDQGLDVCLMMDSVTRVAMAQREVGLSVGEPPTSRGYTPSVFTVLPRLLERTGPAPSGSITAIYTVLVEGDDMNDPIADTVRGILDGHVVLSRKLAHRNHFPAIDILQSVSRVMPAIASQEQLVWATEFRENLANLREAKELQALGGYRPGSSQDLDSALSRETNILGYLKQNEPQLGTEQNIINQLKKALETTHETEPG